MDKYTQLLEFFHENNVQLTAKQMEELQELLETRAHGYTVTKSNDTMGQQKTDILNMNKPKEILSGNNFDKVEMYTREIDILNNKLKRKEISDGEFNNKYKEIENKAGELSKYLSKDGSKSMEKYEHGRGKPTKTNIDNENLEVNYNYRENGVSKIKTIKNPSKEFIDKIQRLNYLANSTDNPDEALKIKNTIAKLLVSKDNNESVKNIHPERDYKIDYDSKNDILYVTQQTPRTKGHVPADFSDDTKLIHNSNYKNIDKLKPTARSKEGILYGDQRVYVSKDHDPTLAKDFRGKEKYEIDPKEIKGLPITKDPDSDKDDYYISTNKKINVNNKNKE